MAFTARLKRLIALCGQPLVVLTLLTAGSTRSLAQTETATISGTITDQSGAFVAGADVTVTNEDTNIAVHTRTNGAGVYNVPALKPGRYKIAVEKEGFKQVVVRAVTLNVQDVVNRNFSLQVGGTSETIQVEGNVASVNTSDASLEPTMWSYMSLRAAWAT